jgi:D-alanine-D-alanine ligase
MTHKAVILFNQIGNDSRADEIDVLDQVNFINEILTELGISTSKLGITSDLYMATYTLKALNPDFVFNLVEAIDGKEELISFAPLLLESLQIPFTGARSEAMFCTTNKILSKEIMLYNKIPTAPFFKLDEYKKTNPAKRYFVKPISKDGSVGIDDNTIFEGQSKELETFIKNLNVRQYYIEEYIHGREFNVSILTDKAKPEILPLAEMVFENYPEGKPWILGFKSKWEENSFEYNNTVRKFNTLNDNKKLENEIAEICNKCWNIFKLNGYARVDLRIDENNRPYVLEINANPCISKNAGFYSACIQAGYDMKNVIKRIIEDI